MQSKERIFYIAKILVLITIIIWFLLDKDEVYVDQYQDQINALNSKIDSLHTINDDLVFKIDTLNNKIVTLDNEINKQDKQIFTLKKKTNEKIKRVDLFNDDELERFFTERYRYYIDSAEKTDSTSSN
jgi:peptidoglycan hydrolase CwlO-like protein